MAKRTFVPLLWTLFSAGGVVAAFLMPVHIFLFGLAFPLGWFASPDHDQSLSLVTLPLTRVYLFVFCSLPLFHCAHRLRYTLYDGLQIKHLNEVIVTVTYGSAVVGTIITGWLLWNL